MLSSVKQFINFSNYFQENFNPKHMRMDETDPGNYRNLPIKFLLSVVYCWMYNQWYHRRLKRFLFWPVLEALNAETSTETDDAEKFGSNISHIGHYSEIAEKSVERFVSAISSFRYSGPGTRASGLRAPLKDIRNTCLSKG